ncbi:hypothetical protein IC229_11590 [Spirosoma sp. BT702]|uniref:Uncharacterized protein n=1 Tax=Spirosoma profusum TaxID=2771354 RepID=A0A926Y0J3_9BACT|nr:hypothetical protein [Spirosoma profusum]MBD2701283.1 hypothetical protein [Spirosoma profusum]
MKYAIGLFSLLLLMAGTAKAQQRSTNQKAGNTAASTTKGSGAGQSAEQYNTTEGDANTSTTTGTPKNSLPRNSNNQTNPTVGTGTTLDQNAGAASNSPSPAVSSDPIPTKTDNTSSVRQGTSTEVKAKKIKPPKEN